MDIPAPHNLPRSKRKEFMPGAALQNRMRSASTASARDDSARGAHQQRKTTGPTSVTEISGGGAHRKRSRSESSSLAATEAMAAPDQPGSNATASHVIVLEPEKDTTRNGACDPIKRTCRQSRSCFLRRTTAVAVERVRFPAARCVWSQSSCSSLLASWLWQVSWQHEQLSGPASTQTDPLPHWHR